MGEKSIERERSIDRELQSKREGCVLVGKLQKIKLQELHKRRQKKDALEK